MKAFLALFTDKETEAQREVTHLYSRHCQKEKDLRAPDQGRDAEGCHGPE